MGSKRTWTEWAVVTFGNSGERRTCFCAEQQAQDYAAKARRAGLLARIETVVTEGVVVAS